MNWLESAYSWVWYHTEFLATPLNRRPFTFIMRDWLHSHKIAFVACLIAWLGGLIFLARYHPVVSVAVAVLTAFFLGHLIWGEKYIVSEQENPPYGPG